MYLVPFISVILFFLAMPAGIAQERGQLLNRERPNVLVIMVDDMNAWPSLQNYPVVKTPALNKLRSQSLTFTNATCAAPVCIPSRASFFSGRYPHQTGAYVNAPKTWFGTPLSVTEVIPETFKKSGYTTWGGGKIFHAEINGNREQAMFDNNVFKGGFGPFAPKEYWHGNGHWFSIRPWEGPDTDFPDVKNADAAIRFLNESHNKPFFMYYGLWRPHTPYTAPKRFFDLYEGVHIETPPGTFTDDLDDVPPMGRELVDSMKKYHKEGLSLQEVKQELLKAYCANMSFADWNIGRVLDALDQSPYADNTVVIFCSDNGFHNGTKNHWTKSTLWDQAGVVPFMVRMPGKQSAECPQTVSLIDIYPTLVELCGLAAPQHQLDGKSFIPVLTDPGSAWNRPSVTTYGPEYVTIRDERYRYIRYPDNTEELYDHEDDPYERRNRASGSALQAVKERLRTYLPVRYAKSIGGRREQ